MNFDPDNHVVKLCSQGMSLEGEGKAEEASQLFIQAWNDASNDFEKFTAAHYIARHQNNTPDKLKWDQIALYHALAIKDEQLNGTLPSLYLNIAKCFEDLDDLENAKQHYQKAATFIEFLPEGGYGNMIKLGIQKGIERVTTQY